MRFWRAGFSRPEGLEPPSSSLEDSCLILLDHGRKIWGPVPWARIPCPRKWSGRQDSNLRNLPLPKRALYQAELRPESASPPAELFCSSASMAIRTAYVTFGDLHFNPSPTTPVSKHYADVVSLLASHVIEVENQRINFTAINARVSLQIG